MEMILKLFFLILLIGVSRSVFSVPVPQSQLNTTAGTAGSSESPVEGVIEVQTPLAGGDEGGVMVAEEETTIAILRPGLYNPAEDDTIIIDADSTDSTLSAEDWEPFTDTSDCDLPMEKGPCRAIIDAWAFNPVSGSCDSFDWSGCGGNSNRFKSRESCETKCKLRTTDSSSASSSASEEPTSSTTSEPPPPLKKKSHQCPRFHGCPSKKCTIVQEASSKGCKKCQCPPESEGSHPFSSASAGKKNQAENSSTKN